MSLTLLDLAALAPPFDLAPTQKAEYGSERPGLFEYLRRREAEEEKASYHSGRAVCRPWLGVFISPDWRASGREVVHAKIKLAPVIASVIFYPAAVSCAARTRDAVPCDGVWAGTDGKPCLGGRVAWAEAATGRFVTPSWAASVGDRRYRQRLLDDALIAATAWLEPV